MTTITVPRATLDALSAALQAVRPADSLSDSRLRLVVRELAALTAANAVSHPNQEITPATEGGAITSESAANAVGEQQFCYCNPDVSLQMVSGGGAPEGYLGRVTLRIGDQYRDYHSHPQATQPAAHEWISVNDQMPPPMERVLASEPRHRTVKVDMWFGPDFQWSYTHWMPLPAAPEAKQ